MPFTEHSQIQKLSSVFFLPVLSPNEITWYCQREINFLPLHIPKHSYRPSIIKQVSGAAVITCQCSDRRVLCKFVEGLFFQLLVTTFSDLTMNYHTPKLLSRAVHFKIEVKLRKVRLMGLNTRFFLRWNTEAVLAAAKLAFQSDSKFWLGGKTDRGSDQQITVPKAYVEIEKGMYSKCNDTSFSCKQWVSFPFCSPLACPRLYFLFDKFGVLRQTVSVSDFERNVLIMVNLRFMLGLYTLRSSGRLRQILDCMSVELTVHKDFYLRLSLHIGYLLMVAGSWMWCLLVEIPTDFYVLTLNWES